MSALTPTSAKQALMYQDYDEMGPMSESKFKSGADLKEGVSGKHKIDSTYENVDSELLEGEFPV